jgi:hypothetical protein
MGVISDSGVKAPSGSHRWKRKEPGWYWLTGTNLEVINMKGQSVKYTGSGPWWFVYVGTQEQPTAHWTLAKAKAAAWGMLP